MCWKLLCLGLPGCYVSICEKQAIVASLVVTLWNISRKALMWGPYVVWFTAVRMKVGMGYGHMAKGPLLGLVLFPGLTRMPGWVLHC